MDAIRIGSSEPGGTFHTQAEAVARLLAARGLQAEALVTPASGVENARRLARGELDFGFIAANWIGRALRGEAPFKQPLAIRMAAPMNAGPLFFIARRDSDVRSLSDLAGRRVVVGPKDGGMANHGHTILSALGIEGWEPVYLDFAAGGQAVVAGRADAQLQCPIPNTVMTALDRDHPLRVIPYNPDELQRLLAAVDVYRPVTMRAGDLRALREDLQQPAVVNVLITHESVPDERVREVVAALVAGAADLGNDHPLFAGLVDLFGWLRDDPHAFEFGGVPLHAGALEAYRAAGLLD
jgi:TRAP transporter TAXI family solute receptor